MKKRFRVKRNEEFQQIIQEGVKTVTRSFIAYRRKATMLTNDRVGISVSKKLGNAVWRNRAKRRMRGLCSALSGPFPGYDVIFLARKSVNETDFDKMLINARRALKKSGIL